MNKAKKETRLPRMMCYALRHRPDLFDLSMDAQGWVSIDALSKAFSTPVNELLQVVSSDTKGRYGLRAHDTEIRCVQGHSTECVDLRFEQLVPPPVLYHGTKSAVIEDIYTEGIVPRSRHYVHLSADEPTAYAVAFRRKGSSVILVVKAKEMHDSGEHVFYRSENGVWLTTHVPPQYLGAARYDPQGN